MTILEMLKVALAGIASSRLYPGEAPAGILGAYVVVPGYMGTPNVTLDGPTNLQSRRVQIDSWADTYLEAEANAKLIEAAMQLQSHVVGSPTMFTSTPLMHEYFGVDAANAKHRVMLEFSLWFYP